MGLRVALIEKSLPMPFSAEQGPDLRVSAISKASESLLTQLGAWQHIQAMRVCPYQRLSVWERSDCRTDFNGADIQADHLGHLIENRIVQLGLHQAIGQLPQTQTLSWYLGKSVKHYQFNQGHNRITFDDDSEINARLIVGADGLQSTVRLAAGIGTQGWQYAQHALAINVKTHASQQDITWQQFTPTGPMAFLPLYDGFASLVWYHHADEVARLKRLSKDKLKAEIVAHFPDELVDFDILECASFPLQRLHANQYYRDGIVLAGDAAHGINPLAGQGVNLGFKDVCALLDTWRQAIDKGQNFYGNTALHQYSKVRRRDNLLMMSTMDGLYALFSNQSGPFVLVRNAGLKLANLAGPVKHQVMRYAMGIN